MFKSNIVLIMIIFNLLTGADLSNITVPSNPSAIESTSTTIENSETIAFNKDLKLYAGNNLSSAQVKALIGIIQVSNNNNHDKQISLNLDSIDYVTNDDLLAAINDISSETSYTVSFEYSPSGFINKSNIHKNVVESPSPSPTSTGTPEPNSTTIPSNTQNPNESPNIQATPLPSPISTPSPEPVHGDISSTVSF